MFVGCPNVVEENEPNQFFVCDFVLIHGVMDLYN